MQRTEFPVSRAVDGGTRRLARYEKLCSDGVIPQGVEPAAVVVPIPGVGIASDVDVEQNSSDNSRHGERDEEMSAALPKFPVFLHDWLCEAPCENHDVFDFLVVDVLR